MSDFYVQRCQQLQLANLQLQEENRSLTAELHEKRNVENELRQCDVKNTELTRRLRELEDYRRAQNNRSEKEAFQMYSRNSPSRSPVAINNENSEECTCLAKERLLEVMEVNSQWKRDFEKLERENQTVKNELEREKLKSTDLQTQKLALESELSRLAHALGGIQQKLTTENSNVKAEDIELIKQQLRVYQDDFDIERRDRERVQSEKDTLREQLQTSEVIISSLREELEFYKNDVRRLSDEIDMIQRRLSNSVQQGAFGMPVNSQPQLQIVYPLTAQTGSPQQQRSLSPAGLSRQHRDVVPRGAAGPPADNFFYGGDVEVDK